MSRASQSVSLLIHAAVIALLLLLTFRPPLPFPSKEVNRLIDPVPLRLRAPAGGGGARQPEPASRGVLPPRSFMPPMIQRVDYQPKLVVPLTIDAPPDVLVDTAIFGDPKGIGNALSGGPGGPLGFGDGHGPSIGGGDGPRYGGGIDGVFTAGHGVTAPIPIRTQDPEYSDEARKAKVSGIVRVYAEIDAQGRPRNLRVLQSAGLGLDEKAVEAVSKWLFRPGTKDGKPVTVRATFELNFRML